MGFPFVGVERETMFPALLCTQGNLLTLAVATAF